MIKSVARLLNRVRLVVGEEPTEITSAKATPFNDPQIDGRMEAVMKFPSGIEANIDVALKSWYPPPPTSPSFFSFIRETYPPFSRPYHRPIIAIISF